MAEIQPNLLLPNYRNLHLQDTDYVGGFTTFMEHTVVLLIEETLAETIGSNYKDALSEPGGWGVYMYMQGETIPKERNHVRLSKDQKRSNGYSAIDYVCWL